MGAFGKVGRPAELSAGASGIPLASIRGLILSELLPLSLLRVLRALRGFIPGLAGARLWGRPLCDPCVLLRLMNCCLLVRAKNDSAAKDRKERIEMAGPWSSGPPGPAGWKTGVTFRGFVRFVV